MNILQLIEAKREGQPLTPQQISHLVGAITAQQVPDYQLAALLMAIYFQGLNREETRQLTLAMRDSGEQLHFPSDPRPVVDKHSTGGVGDKVSLPLAPLLACLGFRVPMISGRGLGITGGTLDKLESIPGFKTNLAPTTIVEQVQTVGCVICGQNSQMVPADKILYALRDVTGTVPSIPLITASILSKKLAEGLDALLLDVKFGCAAFMPTESRAHELAEAMVALGKEAGVKTQALLTNMDRPLGRAAGNWLEVKESVACLEGKGPPDLTELVVTCAARLLFLTASAPSLDEARQRALTTLRSGSALRKWEEMLRAQGANLDAFAEKLRRDHTAAVVRECRASTNGYVSSCDARLIGEAVRDLGGGRFTKESAVNHNVGVDGLVAAGVRVEAGQVLGRIHAANQAAAESAASKVEAAFKLIPQEPEISPLIARVLA